MPNTVRTAVRTVSRRALKRAPLKPMALEPRLMFDGAAVDTAAQATAAADAAAHGTDAAPDAPLAEAPAATPPATEIVFITTSTPDWQKLAGNVRDGVQVVLLDPEQDGIRQVGETLAGRSGLTALHIVSHGADGLILLGNTPLDTDGIGLRSAELAAWGTHLTATADILLYGCDVAASAQGRAFASLLADATGADVAASSDTTGAAAQGGDWNLEYASGPVEARGFLTDAGIQAYDARLATVSLSGASGWTAIMFGPSRDPDGDSQAGAADTDIIGDAAHGSLYTAFSDNGTTGTADDQLYFRMRIDNPTSDTDFSGVAIVGMDANGDGRVDLFISVDGRNNTRAVRLLDPGTGANNSPNTTTTSPLPTGWLPNNGVYAFNPSNYSVDAVSSLNDPHYGPSAVAAPVGATSPIDLTGDGKRDVFISWRVPIADIASVLAKASPVDRSGVYGPRGAGGLPGFTKDTAVKYASFTQTQPGPINGDLNGVGPTYDKNATFATLGAFTPEMTASTPVAASTRLDITDDVPGIASGPVTFTFQFSEGVSGFDTSDITVSGGTKGVFTAVDADTYTLVVTPDPNTASGSIEVNVATDAGRSLAGNLPTAAGSATQAYDTVPPALTIATPASALSGTPTLSGTTDLPDGTLITVTIDPDNDAGTVNSLVYKVAAAGGLWSLNTATTAPLSGSLPAGGLSSYSKVTATATDAAGNSASAVELNRPTVTSQTTSDTTPVITGTWTNIAGDSLTITVSGADYTPTLSGNTWSLDLGTATPTAGTPVPLVVGSYPVTATVTRGGTGASDTTTDELTITNAPPVVAIDISGGATASGSNTRPTITGTAANAGGFVILRLDPNNDGDLSDAVTYSVTPDGGGNWSVNTAIATPISGTVPGGGFIGAIGLRATDSSGEVADTQVLTISAPSIAITSVTSTASTDANAQVNNGDAWINMTEDDAITIAGTAATGYTVDLVIADANGNTVSFSNLTVDGGGNWSVTGANLSSLDSTTLTLTATLSGTSVHTANASYTHDAIAPRIFITNPSEIKKNGGVIYGGSELANTGLTVTVRNSTDTSTVGTWTTTTDANGDWTVTTSGNLVSGASGNVIIKVAPTTAPATDAARNIVGTAQLTQFVAANAATTSISIGTIAGDNLITVNEIGGGLAITGTTTLTGSGTVTLTLDDGDAGTAANVTATGSYASGTWSVNLTTAEIQGLLNGQLTVTASAVEAGGITITDVALPTLSLLTPTLAISDDTPGNASGPVTFTFQFSEGVSGFAAGDITVTNGSKGDFTTVDADTYTLVVTPDANTSGDILVSVAGNVATGITTARGNGSATAEQPFNTTVAAAAPTLTIDADALATDRRPLISGTTNLSPGAPIVITIDPDNDATTVNSLSYSATVQASGSWSLDLGSATPTSGSLPADGLDSWARISATATNAYGNSTTVTAHDAPAVTAQRTSDNTPTVTGTWTNLAGDTLSVAITPAGGGATTTYTTGSGLSIVGNTWSLTSAALADGTYDVVATTTRGGTGKADVSSNELVIDTLGTVDITGPASVSTGDATPLIAGTTAGMPAGTLLTLEIDGNNDGSYEVVYQTTVDGSGHWSVDTGSATPLSGSLPAGGLNGSTPVRATATDPAGNTGIDTQTLVVDLTPPQIAFTSGSRTPSTQPVITGTTDLPAGSSITLVIDADNAPGGTTYTYTAIVQPDGSWRVDTADPSANGGTGPAQSYVLGSTLGLKATATDSVGNSTDASRPLAIDATAPTVAIHAPLDWNGTPDGSLDATEDDNVVVKGSTTGIADGQRLTITLTDGSTTITDSVVVSGNSWTMSTINLSSLAAGPLTVTATHTDSSGNPYSDSATINHVKASTVAIDRISEDSGLVADFVTRDNTVAIYGTATPGATVAVEIRDSGNAVVGSFTVVADGSGAWSTAPSAALTAGNYTLHAAVGGSTASHALTIVNATAPLLSASTPADNATGVAVDANLTLTFDRTIRPGSGTISLYRSSDGALVESYNVSSGLGSITDANGNSLGRISFGSNTITLNPGSDLAAGSLYSLQIGGSAVIDTAGNAYAGIADATTLDFRTAGGANVAPSLGASGGTTAFTEGADLASTPVAIDAGLTVGDVDSPTLASASVAITGNFQAGQDLLAFTNDGSTMGNITASYNDATGVLSLGSAGATATLAQWQAALRAVTYANSSDTPDTATRSIGFTVNDGSADSLTASQSVSVAAANDSPIITAPASIAVTEDVTSPLAGISFSDVDAGGASVTVSLSVPGGSLSASSGDGVTVGGSATALTLSGSIADINAFIAASRLSFTTASNATAAVTLSVGIDDGGNTGAGGARSDSASVTLNVTAQNDAPVVATIGGGSTFTEGAGPVAIDAGLTVGDVDSPTLASASVAITGNFQAGQDLLAFTNDGSTMGNITASYNDATGVLSLGSAGATATLAQWQAALRAVTYANSASSPVTTDRTVSFLVHDGSADSNLATRSVGVIDRDLDAPLISGPSGAPGSATSVRSIAENTTAVATFSANEPVTWQLAGGADAAKFAIDPATGALRFIAAPDFEAPADLGDDAGNNTYVVDVAATDASGNIATQRVTVTVTDVNEGSRPTRTATIARMGRDTGSSATDFITADGSAGRSVEGSLDGPLGADEVVELSFDGGSTWVRASVSGTSWSATDDGAHGGDWTIQARVTNTVANLSGPLGSRSVSLDTTPPATPTVDVLETTSTTPTLTGGARVEAGETLRVSVGGVTYTAGDGHLILNGERWTLTLPAGQALAPGRYAVVARVTDAAGNVASDLTHDELTVADVPPPRLTPPVAVEAPILPQPAPLAPPPPLATPAPAAPVPAPASPVNLDPIRNDPTGDAQLASLRQLSDSNRSDPGIRTRSEGFPIVVLRAADTAGSGSASDAPTLVVNRGIPDTLIDHNGRSFEVPIPNDAFAHSRQDAVISLTVGRSDGRPLPAWLRFDPRMGMFRGTAPAGFQGDVEIRVIARDQSGNQVEVIFRIRVGENGEVIRSAPAADAGRGQPEHAARPGFSAQLRLAGRGGLAGERERLIEQSRQIEARRPIRLPG